ncbi:MAG: hypothetical protein K2G30_08765 [Muribaculaceae bacterium]|nr:hypothetical protein [Muribaculaceae bacterium]MDE7142352.1 hypothetical protein [Muribaculaceae bacterium]
MIAVVILSAIAIITKLAHAVLRSIKLRDKKQLTVSSISLFVGAAVTIALIYFFTGNITSTESADCSAHTGNILIFGRIMLSLGFAATLYLCVKASLHMFRKAKDNGWKEIAGVIFLLILALSTQFYSFLAVIIIPL